MHPEVKTGFDDIAAAVRRGGTMAPNNGSVAPENPMWVDFARHMAPMMMGNAQAIPDIVGATRGQKWKVLDVAAGHGLFGIMMAVKMRIWAH